MSKLRGVSEGITHGEIAVHNCKDLCGVFACNCDICTWNSRMKPYDDLNVRIQNVVLGP